MKAIIPVGGLGTRFFPATKSIPKEMLPVLDTPVIQLIVEEAVEAGISDVIFVLGPGKEAIRSHFTRDLKMEEFLESRGKKAEVEIIRRPTVLADFQYARQEEPFGDGHAILCARDYFDTEEPVVVLFGDDLVDGGNSVQQILDAYQETGDSIILLEKVKQEDIHKYGIVKMDGDKITHIVEKPSIKNAPSDLGVIGKFVLTPQALKVLKSQLPGKDGEVRLVDALESYIQSGGMVRGKILEGRRFDTGSKKGFLSAIDHWGKKL